MILDEIPWIMIFDEKYRTYYPRNVYKSRKGGAEIEVLQKQDFI